MRYRSQPPSASDGCGGRVFGAGIRPGPGARMWRAGCVRLLWCHSSSPPSIQLLGLPVLTDALWEQMRPLLPLQKPLTGRPAVDHRQIVEGMLWVARTNSSWRELPEHFGPWTTVASRYQRWCKEGLWARILHVLLPVEASFASSA
jgi:hypothetical protein